jgi:hypothetical protein
MVATVQNGAVAAEGYSVAEAAAQLGRKPRTIRRYIEMGQLAATRVRTPRGLEYRVTDLTLRYPADDAGMPRPADADRGLPRHAEDDQAPDAGMPRPADADRGLPRHAEDDQAPDAGMPRPAESVPVAENQVLVPIDAWQRMMEQLGNLHQAGQQLADARERAAKAETETTFLRERLAELRAENERLRAAEAPATPASATPEDTPRRPWWRFW